MKCRWDGDDDDGDNDDVTEYRKTVGAQSQRRRNTRQMSRRPRLQVWFAAWSKQSGQTEEKKENERARIAARRRCLPRTVWRRLDVTPLPLEVDMDTDDLRDISKIDLRYFCQTASTAYINSHWLNICRTICGAILSIAQAYSDSRFDELRRNTTARREIITC